MKKLNITVLLFLFAFSASTIHAQVGVINNNPEKSAALDLTGSKGLLIPRVNLQSTTDMTTIANPPAGLWIINTNAAITGVGAQSEGFYYYDGSIWKKQATINDPADNLGNHTASKNLTMNGYCINFANIEGIKVNLSGSDDGLTISQESNWNTAFRAGYKNIDAGQFVWKNYIVNSAAFLEEMRLTDNGFLGIGITDPQAMLHVGAGGTATQQLVIKNCPPAADTDNILYSGAGGQFKQSQLNNTNVVIRKSFALNDIATGTSGTITLADNWPAYMVTVTSGNTCGVNAVASFTVDQENITCLAGIVGTAKYSTEDVGTNGKALKLTATMAADCSGSGTHQFDFTITINGNTIQIQNNNTTTPVSYNVTIVST